MGARRVLSLLFLLLLGTPSLACKNGGLQGESWLTEDAPLA